MSEVPVKINNLTEVIAVAAGDTHSLALTRNGTVWSWGRNNSGQLGVNSPTVSAVPVEVTGPARIVLYGRADASSGTNDWTAGLGFYEV